MLCSLVEQFQYSSCAVHTLLNLIFFFCSLKEPIGWFIHCCQLVVGKGQEMYDGDDEKDEEAPSLDKMLDFCDDLVSLPTFLTSLI